MKPRRSPRRKEPRDRSNSGSVPGGRLREKTLCPDPAAPLPAAFLRSPVRHPLIYRKRIRHVESTAQPGDLVAVYAEIREADTREMPEDFPPAEPRTELIGYGLYNPRSEIAIRMLRYHAELPDEAFWDRLLRQAVTLRRSTLALDRVTDAYRLIHAEADGLPGLVVDRFGDVLSAEVFSLGMFQRCEQILARLAALCDTRHTVIRTSPHILSQEAFESDAKKSADCPASIVVQEYETRFRIQLDDESHKTGFFCDQRENRRQLSEFCRGRSVLDLCCYSGGFSIQAKRLGQAAEVIGVDLDERPLQTARENANLNSVQVRFIQADVFPYMRDMLRAGRQFDVIVLDPPKLIRSRAEIEEGTRKHFDLNRLAMQLLRPGGVMLSCTCAGLLPQENFLRLLYSAARQAGPPVDGLPDSRWRQPRHLRVLAKTGAAADHPIAGSCPETEYLHAVWMTLDDYP